MGLAPGEGAETTGIRPEFTVRFDCEAALSHAFVGAAIREELERARAGIWPPPRQQERTNL